MPTDRLEVQGVVRDSPFELAAVLDLIGAAAIAHVIEDEGAARDERLEVVEQVHPVGDQDLLRAVAADHEEQAHTVVRHEATFGGHGSAILSARHRSMPHACRSGKGSPAALERIGGRRWAGG